MDVVISIATMNSRARLRSCLESIPGACEGLSWHTVVIDNCSSDGTSEMVGRFPAVELLENPEPRGFGANHNQVLRRVVADAQGADYVLVLNDDTILHERSVTALVNVARAHPETGAVSPSVLSPDGRHELVAFCPGSPFGAITGTLTGRWKREECVTDAQWLNGCCLLLSVPAVQRVGVFDERFFMYSEDVDLSLRLGKAGFRLWKCTDATITHYGQSTTGQAPLAGPMQRQRARSFHLLVAKHHGAMTATIVTTGIRLALTVRGLGTMLVGAVAGNERRRRAGRDQLRQAAYSPARPVYPDQERRATC